MGGRLQKKLVELDLNWCHQHDLHVSEARIYVHASSELEGHRKGIEAMIPREQRTHPLPNLISKILFTTARILCNSGEMAVPNNWGGEGRK
jgi:hypothetical protein